MNNHDVKKGEERIRGGDEVINEINMIYIEVEQLYSEMLNDYKDRKFEKLKKESEANIRIEHNVLKEYMINTNSIEYRTGRLNGFLSVFKEIIYESQYEEELSEEINNCSTIYFKNIIELLFHEEDQQHKEIANKLGVKPNQLTNIMKKVLRTGAVKEQIRGKYKNYSLTELGKRYCQKNCNKSIKAEMVNNILNKLKQSLEDDNFNKVYEYLENENINEMGIKNNLNNIEEYMKQNKKEQDNKKNQSMVILMDSNTLVSNKKDKGFDFNDYYDSKEKGTGRCFFEYAFAN